MWIRSTAVAAVIAVTGLLGGGLAEARVIPAPPGVQTVTPGAFCSGGDAGTVGKTTTGLGMVCTYAFGDIRNRWRALDSSSNSQVGTIDRLYLAYFLRVADARGFAYWINLYIDGVAIGTISEGFAKSAEFIRRYGLLTDADFVRLVYRNVLERNPDTSGYRYWTDLLARKVTSRGGVMLNFSESPEYKAKTNTI